MASANRVNPAETMAVFIPSRFRVRMKVRAPGVTVMASDTRSRADWSSPFSRETLSLRDSSKSTSPAMAAAVIAETSASTSASRARRLTISS